MKNYFSRYILAIAMLMGMATSALGDVNWTNADNSKSVQIGDAISTVDRINSNTWYLLKSGGYFLKSNTASSDLTSTNSFNISGSFTGEDCKDFLFKFPADLSSTSIKTATNKLVKLPDGGTIVDEFWENYSLTTTSNGVEISVRGTCWFLENGNIQNGWSGHSGVWTLYPVTLTISDPGQGAGKTVPTTTVSLTSNSIEIGGTSTISVTTDSDGGKTYSSSNTSVATVDANGIITGISAGTATISYTIAETNTYQSDNGSADITVVAAPSPVVVPDFDSENVGKVFRVTQDAAKDENWKTQAYIKLNGLEASHQYEISLYAKATSNFELGPAITDGGSNTNYGANWQITTSWTKFTYNIDANYAPTALMLQFGLLAGTVYVDHVVVKENTTNKFYQDFESATFGEGNSYDVYYGFNRADSWSIETYSEPSPEPDDDDDEEAVIWTGSTGISWGTYVSINASQFTGATAGSKMKIYYSGATNKHIWISHKYDGSEQNGDGIDCPETTRNGDFNLSSTSGSDAITLSETVLNKLSTNGGEIRIYGDEGITISKISIVGSSAPVGPVDPGQGDDDPVDPSPVGDVISWNDPVDRWKTASIDTDHPITDPRTLRQDRWYIIAYKDGGTVTYLKDELDEKLALTTTRPTDNAIAYTWRDFLFSFSEKTTNGDDITYRMTDPNTNRIYSGNNNLWANMYSDFFTSVKNTNSANGFAITNLDNKFTSYYVYDNNGTKTLGNSTNTSNNSKWVAYEVTLGDPVPVENVWDEPKHLNIYGVDIDDACFAHAEAGSTLSIVYTSSGYSNVELKHHDNTVITTKSTVPGRSDALTVVLTQEILDKINETADPVKVYGQDCVIATVSITSPNFEEEVLSGGASISITKPLWTGNYALVTDQGKMMITNSLIAGACYASVKIDYTVTDSESNGSLNIKCAHCTTNQMASIDLGNTDATDRTIEISSALLAQCQTDGKSLELNGNNVTITKIRVIVKKDFSTNGSYDIPLNAWNNEMRIPASSIKTLGENAKIILDCEYDTRENDGYEFRLQFLCTKNNENIGGYFAQVANYDDTQIVIAKNDLTENNGKRTASITLAVPASFVAHFNDGEHDDSYFVIKGQNGIIRDVRISDAAQMGNSAVIWEGDWAADYSGLDIAASKFFRITPGSLLIVEYSDSNNGQFQIISTRTGNWIPMSFAEVNNENVIPTEGTNGEVSLTLTTEILDEFKSHQEHQPIKFIGANVHLRRIRVISTEVIDLDAPAVAGRETAAVIIDTDRWEGSQTIDWTEANSVYIKPTVFDNLPEGSLLQVDYTKSTNPQIQFNCYTPDWENLTDATLYGNTTGLGSAQVSNGNTVYPIAGTETNGTLTITLTQALKAKFVQGGLKFKGQDITITGVRCGVLFQGLHEMSWGNAITIPASSFNVLPNSKLVIDCIIPSNPMVQLLNSNWDYYNYSANLTDATCEEGSYNSKTTYTFIPTGNTGSFSFDLSNDNFNEMKNRGFRIQGSNIALYKVTIDNTEIFNGSRSLNWDNGESGAIVIDASTMSGVDGSGAHTIKFFYETASKINFNCVNHSGTYDWHTMYLPVEANAIYDEEPTYTINPGTTQLTFLLTQRVLDEIQEHKNGTEGMKIQGVKLHVTNVRVIPFVYSNFAADTENPVIYYQYHPEGIKVYMYAEDDSEIYYATSNQITGSSNVIEPVNGIASGNFDAPAANSNHYINYYGGTVGNGGSAIMERMAIVACNQLTKGNNYVLTFRAKATRNYDLGCWPRSSTENKVDYFPSFALTTEWKTFKWEFTAAWNFDEIRFLCGTLEAEGEIFLDDVCVAPAGDPLNNQVLDGYILNPDDISNWSVRYSNGNLRVGHDATVKARTYKNGTWGDLVTKDVKVLANDEMAFTQVRNGVSLCTKEDIISPWINLDQNNYVAGPDFTTKGVNFSTFRGGLTFGYPVFNSTQVSFTPERIVFWVNRYGANTGTISYNVTRNGGPLIHETTVSDIIEYQNGWTKVTIDLSAVGTLGCTYSNNRYSAENICLHISTNGLTTSQYMGLCNICIVGRYTDNRSNTTLEVNNGTYDINLAKYEPVALDYTIDPTTVGTVVRSLDENIASVAIDRELKKVYITGKKNGSTKVLVETEANETQKRATVTLNVNVTRGNTITAAETWDLKKQATQDASVTSLKNLHWATGDGKGLITGTLPGMNNIAGSMVFFDLPTEHNGGIVTVTFGSKSATATSVQVNSYLALDSESGQAYQTKQRTWAVESNVETVFIAPSVGDHFADGVITSISWMPFPPEKPNFNQDYAVKDNSGNSIAPSTIEITNCSLENEEAYIINSNVPSIKVSIPKDSCTPNKYLRITACSSQFSTEYMSVSGNSTLENIKLASYDKKTVTEIRTNDACGVEEGDDKVFTITLSHHAIGQNQGNPFDAAILKFELVAHDYVRNVSKGRINTVCLPFNVAKDDMAGARFFQLTNTVLNNSNNEIMRICFEEVDHLEASRPYIYIADNDFFTIDYSGDAEITPIEYKGMIGLYDLFYVKEHGWRTKRYYGIANNSLKYAGQNASFNANTCLIDIDRIVTQDDSNDAPVAHLYIEEDGYEIEEYESETAIENIMPNNMNNTQSYDLYGRSTNSDAKGFVLSNRKMILVK